MSPRTVRSAAASAAAALLAPAWVWAQTTEPVDKFVAEGDALEAMKYRHLWIAYAVIWLLIMVFVWRTARRQADLKKDLEHLSARVDEMEKTRE